MSDERDNKSSGSKFSIDAACPGNQNLIASLSTDQRNAAQPEDPLATTYEAMGISPAAEIHDREGRPIRICDGRAVSALFG